MPDSADALAAATGGLLVRPVSSALGVEISGVDLSASVCELTQGALRQALARHGVIFFRDQRLTPQQHLTFARIFGSINVNRFFKHLDGHPEISEVRKEPHHQKNIGGGWHTDHSYDEVPAMGSVLLAHEVPASGGDTMFTDMALAYDALSPGYRTILSGLRARHSSRHVFGAEGRTQKSDLKDRIGNTASATQDAVHPVVIRHPTSGRKVLYVNPGFTLGIEGWNDGESRSLLDYLYGHAIRPEFTCRFRWEPGSIAVWDNRRTWHYALNDYPGQRRLMHRITVDGVPLAA